jgi:hypothetical protein
MWKKIEMMLIDCPHSKKFTIWNFWNFKILKVKNMLNKNLKFQESFTTCKWGVMYMTSINKLKKSWYKEKS